MSAPAFAINGRFYDQPVTGVQRYARAVVSALDSNLSTDGSSAVLLTPSKTQVPSLLSIDHRPVGPSRGHFWEQTVLPLHWRGQIINLCNTAPIINTNQIVCIHDANVFIRPDSYSRHFRVIYRALMPALASRSARITTVSVAAARQIATYLPISERDIVVLPNGHEHALLWHPARSTLPPDIGLKRAFILTLGSRARHKNIGLLINLAPSLNALGLDLIIAGGGDSIFADSDESPHPNVHRLGAVSDDDLALLMDRALCLAFPSFTEGFGLPIVEAMARGCPVVSSNRASMPEICGNAALMASPDEPSAWLKHFASLQGSRALTAELRARGHEQVKLFSWANTAAGYRSLVANPSSPSLSGATIAKTKPLPSVGVIVATRGRPDVVASTVRLLVATQTHTPCAIFVSCAEQADAGGCAAIAGVQVIIAPAGLAAQRNAGLAALPLGTEVVVFFDDDFVADPRWLEAAAVVFRDRSDVVALTGNVLADDVKGPGLSFEEALGIIRSSTAKVKWDFIEHYSPYGCNMAFRASAIQGHRFDERLVLYGWLEDRDFAAMLSKSGGSQIKISSARGVHMGAKGGRVPGLRLGYSQVTNPVYMNRKGTMSRLLVLDHLARNILSNLVGSFRPEPHIDRFGRLKGNMRGLLDLARGRIEPERAASL